MQQDLELTTINVLSLFETNKKQRQVFVDDIMDKLTNELAEPLKVHLYLKAMAEIINSLTNRDKKTNKNFEIAIKYNKLLLEAAESYGKKFSYQNAEFEIKETGSSLSWDKCNDALLVEYQNQFDEAKKQLDERKEMLKALPLSGMEVVDKSTGEMVSIYPPSKSSTTSVTVSLK